MALYKYAKCIRQVDSPAFDKVHPPRTPAPWPGIYQCDFCGDEIAIAQSHILPSDNHHKHKSTAPIRWRLIVGLREE